MVPRRATGAARSSEAALGLAAPLLESRIKSSRELQTVREMVGSKNSVMSQHVGQLRGRIKGFLCISSEITGFFRAFVTKT
jgi:hypothetical protein